MPDLKSDLKSELSGNFCDLVLFLMMDYHYSLAKCCYKAISGAGTNESVLIEVLCTATNEDIIKIKDSYLKGEYMPF
ncbi:unnamed protein product [Protopolystoma xenopodis]|uniref:Annexin n=1 Tax=Protopolystoma xenopodis TaxID=117903 RepID=A0A3S5AYW7_9PLAT|nr:unnamed protein product [Protopolystoma xenopodis]